MRTLQALAAQAVLSAGNFLTTILLGRAAGLEGIGLYSMCLTVFFFLCAIQESLVVLPYTVYGNRLEGHARARCEGAALMRQLGLTTISVVLLAMTAVALIGMKREALLGVILVLMTAMPFMLLREFGRRMAFADLRVLPVLVLDVLVTTIALAGLSYLAYAERLTAATALRTVGAAAALGAVVWLARDRHRLRFDSQSFREELRRSWSLGGWALWSRITNFAESYSVHWLLAAMLGTAATGGFAAAMTVVALSNPLLLGIGSILTPYAAKLYREEGSLGLRKLSWAANIWLLPTMFVFSMTLLAFGDVIVTWLFAGEVSVQPATIRLLALGVLAAAAGMTSESVLRVTENTKANFLASLGGICVSTVLTILTANFWGTAGAALGMALGCLTATILRWIAARSALQAVDI